jgi:hypothetical protein
MPRQNRRWNALQVDPLKIRREILPAEPRGKTSPLRITGEKVPAASRQDTGFPAPLKPDAEKAPEILILYMASYGIAS